MAGTRSSGRLSSQPKSSPTQSQESPKAATGSKRKLEAGSSPSAKRGRKSSDKKEQKTIEDTMEVDQSTDTKNGTAQNGKSHQPEPAQENQEQPSKVENASSEPKNEEQSEEKDSDEPNDSTANKENEPTHAETKTLPNGHKSAGNAENRTEGKDDMTDNKSEKNDDAPAPAQDTSKMDDTGKVESNKESQNQSETTNNVSGDSGDAIESHARDKETPSSILEKGIIYFFFRGRVGIDSPSEINDLARSYMVLRPIPHGAKIGEGLIGDGHGKCRLLALPKKVLPLNGKDKFMTFVEKSKTTFKELKEDFLSASDYNTRTAGVRHTPSVTPVAEGVYAITTTGRESHLAYILTIPQELGEVQKDMGLRAQGSFITSAKNPQYAGPANTNLDNSPDFPKEIIDEFRNLRWAPLQPKFLDYENTQFLLIGESDGIDSAVDQQSGENGDAKEELEKLEGEDEIRIKHLKGDDSVFADLGISKKEYPQVPSTWND